MKSILTVAALGLSLLAASGGAGFSQDFEKGVAALKEKDYATALREWRSLAAQGNASAQYNLGWMYANGQGVTQDYKEAARLYGLAAAQGNASAQGNLGSMYANGQGVTQDYKEAARLYGLAAAQGNALAQWDVGRLYFTGKGVGQDQAAAVNWFRKAADQGLPVAKEMLNAIAENERVTQNINKPKNLVYLSCHINFETPVDASMTIDFDNETINGYPAIISQNEIKFTAKATDAEKAIWLKKREKSHENSVTINRINGFFVTTSDFYGATYGSCNKIEGPKF